MLQIVRNRWCKLKILNLSKMIEETKLWTWCCKLIEMILLTLASHQVIINFNLEFISLVLHQTNGTSQKLNFIVTDRIIFICDNFSSPDIF